MNRKMLTGTVGFLVFVVFVGVIYGAYTIWSNTVTVEVTDYTFTLDASPKKYGVGQTVRFYGELKDLDGNPMGGYTMTLYRDNVSTGLTNVTASDGSFSILWTASEKGIFDFNATVTVP